MLLPLIAALGISALPAMANEYIVRDVTVQPPAPMAEEAGVPREGYIWAPGYYDYAQNKHNWHKGHYVRERKGYTYVAPRWENQNGHWSLYSENWVKDDNAKDKRSQDGRHVAG
jgi:hypothetical protein